MKLIIMEENGCQLASKLYNGHEELFINAIIEQYGYKYILTKFVKISDHYIVFNGIELKK